MRSRPSGNRKDCLLIGQLKGGNRGAFDEIFRTHLQDMHGQALRLTGRRMDAEDVVQEVFLTVYRKIKTFRGQSQFKTWLYRIVTNAALMRLREYKKQREVSLDGYLPSFCQDGRHRITPVSDSFHEVDDPSKRYELQELLGEALYKLRPLDRTIILMSDLEGFADREIASILGLSLPALKTRLHRARLFLRGKLVD